MTDNFIQLHKDNKVKIKIVDYDGNDTGEFLEFDITDINLALNLDECYIKHKKNFEFIKNKIAIIEKRQDFNNKSMLSRNEREKAEAIKEFYEKEEEALDLFLGKGGTKKMLNGRSFNLYTFDQLLDELKPITNMLKNQKETITEEIMKKYSISNEEVLK